MSASHDHSARGARAPRASPATKVRKGKALSGHAKGLAKGKVLHGYAIKPDKAKKARWGEILTDANILLVDVGADERRARPMKRWGKLLGRVQISQAEPVAQEAPAAAPAIREEAFRPGAKARALLRGIEIVEQDLKASGGAFSLLEVCTLMRGVSRQAVHKRANEGSLLAVPGPSNRNVYPVVQFSTDGMPVDGLKEVREALGTRSPWMLLNFLIHAEPRLDGMKPIDLLKAGKLDAVLEAARRMGTQGA